MTRNDPPSPEDPQRPGAQPDEPAKPPGNASSGEASGDASGEAPGDTPSGAVPTGFVGEVMSGVRQVMRGFLGLRPLGLQAGALCLRPAAASAGREDAAHPRAVGAQAPADPPGAATSSASSADRTGADTQAAGAPASPPEAATSETSAPGAGSEAAPVEVLLLSSLDTGRWIIPKGWPMTGRSLAGAAMQEAWEEGGIRGRLRPEAVGSFTYEKRRAGSFGQPVEVRVFVIDVQSLAQSYPEVGRRKRQWFSPREAAELVDEPGLRAILLSL